ncbi:hypothetical protein FOCC_FOCC014343 [Frankliniella occidentalis]|nr:hypothetical protein FOCC_FOCC014343 [Frankliniella occidentalis]
MLAITADERKLPPYVVFKRLTVPKGKSPPRVHIRAAESGSFNEDITVDWLKTVWEKRPGALLNLNNMLVMDSFRGHLTEQVKDKFKRMQTDMVIIPGGMTSLLQPLDICINKPFKNKIEEYYCDWMVRGEKQYTLTGRIKRPDPELLISWVKKAWDSIPKPMVVKYFKKAFISNALDGSEDDILWMDLDNKNDDEDYEEGNEESDETDSESNVDDYEYDDNDEMFE